MVKALIISVPAQGADKGSIGHLPEVTTLPMEPWTLDLSTEGSYPMCDIV